MIVSDAMWWFIGFLIGLLVCPFLLWLIKMVKKLTES
jgi:hypothetical protein